MLLRHLGAARHALRLCQRPSGAGRLSQRAALVGLSLALLLRSMSHAAHPHATASEQYTAVPASVAASVPPTSNATLQSLLTVCVGGLCARRLQWAELALLINEGRLEALGRLDWQLAHYFDAKKNVLHEYHSMTDRLRDQRLAAPCRLEDGKKRCDWTQQPADRINTPPPGHPMRALVDDDGLPLRVCWWRNEYGYAIDSAIQHHLIWSDRYLPPHSRLVQQLLAEYRPESEFEILTFINPPHLRSIPNLHHQHVFSRPRQRQQQQQQHEEGEQHEIRVKNSADELR